MLNFVKVKNVYKTKHSQSIISLQKRFIYYDNLEIDRNLDFVFNLGYNDIPSKIKPNVGLFKLTKFLMKRKLLYLMKHYYKHLLESIEKGEVQIFDEIMDKNLKYSLYLDLKKFYEKKYSIKVINSGEPVYLKILNVFEMDNVSVSREENGEISEYDFVYGKKGRIMLNKYDPQDAFRLEGKSQIDVKREREFFDKSEYKTAAYEQLKNEVKIYYGMEYARKKMGNKFNEKNVEYISNLIEQLENNLEKADPYSQEIRIQFSDYYKDRQTYIDEKLKSTDLYEFFRVNMPSHYKNFYENYLLKMGMFKRLLNSLRSKFYKKYTKRSKQISRNKTLYVIDVEVTSKMRLEITDEEGKNIIDSEYGYSDKFKRDGFFSYDAGNSDLLEYDTSVYKFSIPDRKWNLKNNEFMQTHLIRFEYEQKNKFRNIFRHTYNTLLITDIDLSLKGNKHFKFIKNYI